MLVTKPFICTALRAVRLYFPIDNPGLSLTIFYGGSPSPSCMFFLFHSNFFLLLPSSWSSLPKPRKAQHHLCLFCPDISCWHLYLPITISWVQSHSGITSLRGPQISIRIQAALDQTTTRGNILDWCCKKLQVVPDWLSQGLQNVAQITNPAFLS